MEVEQDNPEVRQRRLWAPKPKAKAKQVVQQSYDASELRPQHVTHKKDRAERAKEREERKAQCNRNRAREQGLRKHELSWRERLQKIYEKCAWLHMAPRRKTMLSASLRRVWRTQREKDEHMATKAGMPKERRRNFNHMQAFNDIYCRSDDEDEDVELQRKKHSEGVWIEDNCEDSKRPTLQENIEKEHFIFEYLCEHFVFSYGRNFEH